MALAFTTWSFMLSLGLLLDLVVFTVLFSIVITSLWEKEKAGICASRAFVCLFYVSFLFLLVPVIGCGL